MKLPSSPNRMETRVLEKTTTINHILSVFTLFRQSHQTGERAELPAVADPVGGNGAMDGEKQWLHGQSSCLGRGAGAAWAPAPGLPARFAGSGKGLSEVHRKLQLGRTNREETLKMNFTI